MVAFAITFSSSMYHIAVEPLFGPRFACWRVWLAMSEAALRERKREIDMKYAEVRKAWKKARRSECAAEAGW